MQLMRSMRENIEKGTFPDFVKKFVKELHPDMKIPSWIINSLASVGIDVL